MKYKLIATNLKKSLKMVYNELSSIIKLYDVDKLYQKSLPLKPTKKCNNVQLDDVNKFLEKTYYPYFDALLPMIESGIVECEPILHECQDVVSKTIYESWDRLFNLQFIKYNLILSCIMQIYLFLEQSLIKDLNKYYNFQKETLQDAILFLEQNFIFKQQDKNILDLYRNIINVYKHGFGRSYNRIKKTHPDILNDNDSNIKNYEFIFKLNKISVDEIYSTVNSLLDSIS